MVEEHSMLHTKKIISAFLKYAGLALILSIVFETLSLLFTDNQMYAADGSVQAMRVVNWFRVAVWFFLSIAILYRGKRVRTFFTFCLKKINRKSVCRIIFLL